ncbi:MAG: DUF2235 domain-containing protein [Desulfobacterales bacterium]|nr:DUF2235 domain-containing protein [Desulfobacterales bacterium]
MKRNLIICCDGTGNEIKDNQSNVLKFYRLIKKDDTQIGFYDPGVGTISDSNAWARFKNKAKGVFGLATGYGLDTNILEAYRFLTRNYKDGDQIYLLGFSRGAYTVRVLAGFIYMVGLLNKHNENLFEYALTAYKQASNKDDLSIAWRFQEVMDTKRVTIHFMGCWDTVGSVIIPRPDRLYLPSIETLPYTLQNTCVKVFRHAMAIDERRRMFRLMPWKEGGKYKSNPFVKEENAQEQDIKQIWFSGVYSDIGGGYPETESGAAKIPLKWMVDEASTHGIVFRENMVKRLVDGENPKNSTRQYVSPGPNADLHDSMTPVWALFEMLPKSIRRKEWKKRKSFFGFYLPKAEPRTIKADADIHPSVFKRSTYAKNKPYRPVNINNKTGS